MIRYIKTTSNGVKLKKFIKVAWLIIIILVVLSMVVFTVAPLL